MVGNLAASVGLVYGDAQCGQFIFRGDEVVVTAQTAPGVDVVMLQKQEGVGGLAVVDLVDQNVLQLAGVEVFDCA